MMIESILSVVGGYLLHQLRRITEKMPMGFQQLTSYAMGVAGSLPFVGLFGRRLGKREHRCFISYLLGFLFVGIGVALGWLMDTIKEE